jgi:hypothetical protein
VSIRVALDGSPRRWLEGLAAHGGVLAVLGIVWLGLSSPAALADACPNASVRFGPSAKLPDCRAYELVTPRFKEDNSTLSAIHGFSDGDHLFFTSLLPLPGAQNGEESEVLSTRTAQGWVTTSLTPPAGAGEPTGYGVKSGNFGVGSGLIKTVSFASDFSAAFVNSPFQYGELDQNKQWNTFRVDVPTGVSSIESLPDSGPMTEALIDPPGIDSTTTDSPEQFVPGAFIAGNAADGSRVYFETTVQLPTAAGTPQDTHLSGNELYEHRGGHTYLVGVLPGESESVPACGAEVGGGGRTSLGKGVNGRGFDDSGTISSDGSDVVFSSPSGFSNSVDCPEAVGKYYLREDNGQSDAKTVELPGTYIARTADEKKLFLVNEGSLYEYEIASGQTTLVDNEVPPVNLEGKPNALLGSSADGSRVYIAPATWSSGGHISLYENGTIKSLPIPAAGIKGYESTLPAAPVRNRPIASADGSRFVFVDSENLTSYDSQGHHEVYMYDATDGSIACISCNPDGSPPEQNSGLLAGESAGLGGTETVVPAGLDAPVNGFTQNMYPAVSNDDKHVFFQSQEALVQQDTNGLNDVYEWEALGEGGCGAANTNYSSESGGCVYLLSSGTGSNGSWIAGASEDGRDVFIVSNDSLTPQVDEASQEIYDARVGGGFPYTPPVFGCDSGQCQGPQTPAPLLLAPPPSATFMGLGNPTPETDASVKSKSKKPVKHKKKKKVKGGGKHRKAVKRKGRK